MAGKKSFEETILTVSSIKDFQICALLHDYRHRQNLSEPIYSRELMAQRYENTLKRVLSFFFYKKQANLTPSYNALVNRWEKLWFPKDMTAYDLAIEQHETWHGNLASYSNAATLSLLKFHEDFADSSASPILINEEFLVPIHRHIRLSGTFDLVLREKDKYRIIYISGQQKRPTIGSLLLEFAALSYAFQYRNGARKMSAKFSMYDVGSAKPGMVAAAPKKRDVNALFYWATQAAEAEIYAPRRGLTAYCRGCPFDEPCSHWAEWPERREIALNG